MRVGFFQILPSGEGAGEHEDGGFWRVEIGDQAVDRFELVAWVDEDVGFATEFVVFKNDFVLHFWFVRFTSLRYAYTRTKSQTARYSITW